MASGMQSCWKLKLNVPLTGHQVGQLTPELDGDTATCVLRVAVESQQCRACLRVREVYIRVRTP